MIINYTTDENDFLVHQLFVASKSDRIKKSRKRNRVLLPPIYFLLGAVLMFAEDYTIAATLFIVGALWYFLYPVWERRHYIRHFKAFIHENYKERFGKSTMLEIANDFISIKDSASEAKVNTTELERIDEIQTTIFIRLRGGQSFILPKDKIPDIDKVITRLKELAAHLKIQYDMDEKWEWK